MSRETVGIDATPLHSAHAIRGIGRYVASVLSAITKEHSEWTAEHLRTLVRNGDPRQAGTALPWRTRRPSIRPQDTAWLIAAISDRYAVGRDLPRVWHQTDPATPFGPLPPDRTIVTLYDLIPLVCPEVRARIRLHRWLIHKAYLRLVRSAGLVIAISQVTAEEAIARLGVDPVRIRVVYPAVSPLADKGVAPQPGEEIELLFVGVPDPHKRPDLAIRALAELRRRGHASVLRLVGPQPDRDLAQLRALAHQLDVHDHVVFMGRVDDRELGRLYARSILLAVSSVEGFGLPAVEAVLSGGRVVAASTPIYRETLDDAAVFAPMATPGSVAEAILVARVQQPSGEVTARLARRYSAVTTGQALLDAYQAALHL